MVKDLWVWLRKTKPRLSITCVASWVHFNLYSGVPWEYSSVNKNTKMYCLFLLLLLQTILSCHCQVSFTITRSESGDEVASSLTSADYCSAIHGYLDGSQCKCDTRYTFSLEHQVCIDYYNGKNILKCMCMYTAVARSDRLSLYGDIRNTIATN